MAHVSHFHGILADQRSWQQMGRHVSSLTAMASRFHICQGWREQGIRTKMDEPPIPKKHGWRGHWLEPLIGSPKIILVVAKRKTWCNYQRRIHLRIFRMPCAPSQFESVNREPGTVKFRRSDSRNSAEASFRTAPNPLTALMVALKLVHGHRTRMNPEGLTVLDGRLALVLSLLEVGWIMLHPSEVCVGNGSRILYHSLFAT